VAPDFADSDFTWQGFVERNNNELVATWGNLVNRVLTFAYRHWEGHVPEPGIVSSREAELLGTIDQGVATVADLYAQTRFKAALRETMALSQEVNRYLDEKSPWFQIKIDQEAAATSIFVALRAIDSLKILFAPILPFTCERVHYFLGYGDRLFGDTAIERFAETAREHEALVYHPLPTEGTIDRWEPSTLEPGRQLRAPEVLFQKIDESVIEQERQRLRG
jgi:methionyl-tRNA synthetase